MTGRRKGGSKREYAFREYSENLLGQERGAVPLKKGASVKIALVYPNRYAVGMASMGFQTVYRLFNAHPDIRCERAFAVNDNGDGVIRTLESNERLNRFDLIGFSLSFELDIVNFLRSLVTSGIPPERQDRSRHDPVVLLGGVIAGLNPSPLLPFLDGLLVGEGEDLFFKIGDVFRRFPPKKGNRRDTLAALSKLEGIYIPGMSLSVRRQVIGDLDIHPTYTPIVSPKSHFKNMFVVEIGRGCPKGCRFCAAHQIYRPVRYRSVSSLLATVEKYNPGAKKIGLEGAGISDYPGLSGFSEQLIQKGFSIALSSIRPDKVTTRFLNLLEEGKVQSFSIAPETGSKLLRFGINKKMHDEAILDTARKFADTSIPILKLYFLIGLPNEGSADIEAIVSLIKKITHIQRFCKKEKQIKVSVNAFVPKPFTPFQNEPMNIQQELERKRKTIRSGLKNESRVIVVPKSAKEEIFQGLLSVGNESVGLGILDSIQRNIPWKKAMRGRSVDIETLLFTRRDSNSPKPWDFILSS